MITSDHEQQILLPRAITAAQAEAYGVRSVEDITAVPGFEQHRYAQGSGLLFTWHSPLKGEVLQFRPDNPVKNDDGDLVKYAFPNGQQMVLTKLRDPAPDAPMLLQEGTCQSLAAAIYSQQGWAIYGMSGCWSWRRGSNQVAIPDLMVAEGRDVVIGLDADAASNKAVYDAGLSLKEALEAEGASTVRFFRLGGHGAKAGLDDVLGERPEDKRAGYLQRLLSTIHEKPAEKPPKQQSSSRPDVRAAAAGRPVVVVNEDRYEVINQLTEALRARWSGTELFDYGGILARRTGAEVRPVTKPTLDDLLAEATLCVSLSAKGDATAAWPDERSRDSTLARADRFSPLERISRVPFVRADGTIAQAPGYDETSATYLALDEDVAAVAVPDEPTPEDVQSAVKLLCDEWLGDLMAIMPEAADRANALALVLTPLIRGLVPLAPLAVVDGLQMGVGKNLLADVVSIFAVGKPSNPLPYSREDDENRKVITSSFRAGHDLFVFDEAHSIEGRHLARAITSITYSDRILGVSSMVEYPNRVTWVALGNNVSIAGDLARRVYRIRLAPKAADPHNRDVQSYRHPDLKRWTTEHRAELVAAGLTLVRAWFAGERVENANGRRFASFEAWAGMVGGVLDAAGVHGFLDNMAEWRSESDFETSWWVGHLSWLRAQFGDSDFTTHDVVTKMQRSGSKPVEHPPRLENHDDRGYSRQLGMAYGRVKGRVMAGLQLVKTVDSPGHGNRWRVDSFGDGPSMNVPIPATDGDNRRSTIVSTHPSLPVDSTTTEGDEVDETPTPSVDSPCTDGNQPRSDTVSSQNSINPSTERDNARSDTVVVQRVVSGDRTTPQSEENSSIYTYVCEEAISGGDDGSAITQSTRSTRTYRWQPLTGADPLSSLLPLCAPVPDRVCPDCDSVEVLTPDGLTLACPVHHGNMWRESGQQPPAGG